MKIELADRAKDLAVELRKFRERLKIDSLKDIPVLEDVARELESYHEQKD